MATIVINDLKDDATANVLATLDQSESIKGGKLERHEYLSCTLKSVMVS